MASVACRFISSSMNWVDCSFFFFQAEDGIRDTSVTGVQTCALPIYIYVDIEDKDNVAVVDAKTLTVTAHYELGDKGGTPAGLAFDVKNHILFVACRKPANMVMLNADDGKFIAALPLGAGTDGAVFNPATMEAFSSQGDGTLTVIKENNPTTFVVEQTVTTPVRAKTLTLDSKTNNILLI